nr:MAG TPA: hypothetical protein [Caudoviricetes sp.]
MFIKGGVLTRALSFYSRIKQRLLWKNKGGI